MHRLNPMRIRGNPRREGGLGAAARKILVLTATVLVLTCPLGLFGCNDASSTGTAVTASTVNSTTSTVGGIVSITANAQVYPTTAMIASIVIQYNDDIDLPNYTGNSYDALYTITDSKATYGTRDIEAVYTNSEPSTREDKTSVEGPYVVIELEPERPDGTDGWSQSTDMGFMVSTANGITSLRIDLSGFSITQRFDAKNAAGTPLRSAGTLRSLESDDVNWSQLTSFTISQTFESTSGDLNYSFSLPDDYSDNGSYPLVVVMPGENAFLRYTGRDVVETASLDVNLVADSQVTTWADSELAEQYDGMPAIVLAPQPTADDEAAAEQVWELVSWFSDSYAVDPSRILATGYSQGAQIMSRVVCDHADSFDAYLHVAGQWDGDMAGIAQAGLPIFLFGAAGDTTVSDEGLSGIYAELCDAYEKTGLTTDEVDALIVLDQPDDAWFAAQGCTDYHAGGSLVCNDESAVEWLLSQEHEE